MGIWAVIATTHFSQKNDKYWKNGKKPVHVKHAAKVDPLFQPTKRNPSPVGRGVQQRHHSPSGCGRSLSIAGSPSLLVSGIRIHLSQTPLHETVIFSIYIHPPNVLSMLNAIWLFQKCYLRFSVSLTAFIFQTKDAGVLTAPRSKLMPHPSLLNLRPTEARTSKAKHIHKPFATSGSGRIQPRSHPPKAQMYFSKIVKRCCEPEREGNRVKHSLGNIFFVWWLNHPQLFTFYSEYIIWERLINFGTCKNFIISQNGFVPSFCAVMCRDNGCLSFFSTPSVVGCPGSTSPPLDLRATGGSAAQRPLRPPAHDHTAECEAHAKKVVLWFVWNFYTKWVNESSCSFATVL